MTSPITIPELDPAGPIDPANDYVVVRQGLGDKKATVDQINQPAVAIYPSLPTPLTSTDLVLVNRGGTNYSVNPQAMGFLVNTYSWFYQTTAPLNWTIVPNSGDRILGTSDAQGNLYNGALQGTPSGTWQQTGHVLDVTEIPSHDHGITLYQVYTGNGSGHSKVAPGKNSTVTGSARTDPTGTNAAHNHGNSWRPAAMVGILCQKTS